MPSTVVPGKTYSISGTQFNGLSQAGAYGDDFQDARNYPLVQIVNGSTGHVFYCKTDGHRNIGVATGSTSVSTNFHVPTGIEAGASQLFVIANCIPSAPVSVTVTAPPPPDFSISANPTATSVGRGHTATYTITLSPGEQFRWHGQPNGNGLPLRQHLQLQPQSGERALGWQREIEFHGGHEFAHSRDDLYHYRYRDQRQPETLGQVIFAGDQEITATVGGGGSAPFFVASQTKLDGTEQVLIERK